MKRWGLRRVSVWLTFSIAVTISLIGGELFSQDLVSVAAGKYLGKVPIVETDPTMTAQQARAAQERFLAIIGKGLGGPVGYKAGLTNPNSQKAFGVSEPVRGTLLKGMMLKAPSTVPADFGTRSFSEGDIMVRVGNEAINGAGTPDEALKYLDAVIPCIELADLGYDKSVKLTAPAIVLINVGTRFFVLGEPIQLAPSPQWRSRLTDFTVRIYGEKDEVLAEGKGKDILGDPLNVVLWIKDSLAAEGKKLHKGDLLSLGSVTKIIPSRPGSDIRARYTGLDPDGPVDVRVSFR